MCSWLALVLNLSSKLRNTNSVKDIDYNIVVITANVASCISIIMDLNLVGQTVILMVSMVLNRRLVRRFWSVWLDMFVVSHWLVNMAR